MNDCITMGVRLVSCKECDYIQVVRCKDCKWFYVESDMCCCTKHTGLPLIKQDGSSFCSYGERRADSANQND